VDFKNHAHKNQIVKGLSVTDGSGRGFVIVYILRTREVLQMRTFKLFVS